MKFKSNNKPAICLASVAVLGMLSTRPPRHTSGQGQGLLYPRGGTLHPPASVPTRAEPIYHGTSVADWAVVLFATLNGGCRAAVTDSRNWFRFSIWGIVFETLLLNLLRFSTRSAISSFRALSWNIRTCRLKGVSFLSMSKCRRH